MSDTTLISDIGWEFPPRFDLISKGPAMLSGEADVANSIYVIIHTRLGERILREEFGSNIHELLFEPLNENMKTYMASSLRLSLETNEPRIQVKELRLAQNEPSLGRVDIFVRYTLLETSENLDLTVPFYTPDNLNLV